MNTSLTNIPKEMYKNANNSTLKQVVNDYIIQSSTLYGKYPRGINEHIKNNVLLPKSGILIREGITKSQLNKQLELMGLTTPVWPREKSLINLSIRTKNWNVQFITWKNYIIIRNSMPYMKNHLLIMSKKNEKDNKIKIPQFIFEMNTSQAKQTLLDMIQFSKLTSLTIYFNGTMGNHLAEFHGHITTEKGPTLTGSCKQFFTYTHDGTPSITHLEKILKFIEHVSVLYGWSHNMIFTPTTLYIRFGKRETKHARKRWNNLGSGTCPAHNVNVIGGSGESRKNCLRKYYKLNTINYDIINVSYDTFCKKSIIDFTTVNKLFESMNF